MWVKVKYIYTYSSISKKGHSRGTRERKGVLGLDVGENKDARWGRGNAAKLRRGPKAPCYRGGFAQCAQHTVAKLLAAVGFTP